MGRGRSGPPGPRSPRRWSRPVPRLSCRPRADPPGGNPGAPDVDRRGVELPHRDEHVAGDGVGGLPDPAPVGGRPGLGLVARHEDDEVVGHRDADPRVGRGPGGGLPADLDHRVLRPPVARLPGQQGEAAAPPGHPVVDAEAVETGRRPLRGEPQPEVRLHRDGLPRGHRLAEVHAVEPTRRPGGGALVDVPATGHQVPAHRLDGEPVPGRLGCVGDQPEPHLVHRQVRGEGHGLGAGHGPQVVAEPHVQADDRPVRVGGGPLGDRTTGRGRWGHRGVTGRRAAGQDDDRAAGRGPSTDGRGTHRLSPPGRSARPAPDGSDPDHPLGQRP